MSNKDKIIVALDFESCDKALALVESLDGYANFFKIGLGLIGRGGLELARELKKRGLNVFLDLKLFDISNTIKNAVSGLCEAKFDFLTVQGDPQIIKAAVEGRGTNITKILAVTFLTSLNRKDLDQNFIIPGEIQTLVCDRAEKAILAGADGVIASPLESKKIRDLESSAGKLIVTPGVRPKGADLGDQKRISTPSEAIKNGSNHIVVGRPIIQSANPKLAAHNILAEINSC